MKNKEFNEAILAFKKSLKIDNSNNDFTIYLMA